MTATLLAVSLAAVVVGTLAWRLPTRRLRTLAVAAMLVLLAILGLTEMAAGTGEWGPGAATALLALLAALAVAGGGPLAVLVLDVADGHPGGRDRDPAAVPPGAVRESQGGPDPDGDEVLRGGAWIGSLERIGIFATLAAGWPEGVAVVLAVKGVGRYQEIGATPGAAERFIIGTFVSVLWALACAAVWWFAVGWAGGLAPAG